MRSPRRLRLTVDYGYDLHSVLIERDDWQEALSGEPVVVEGQGFWLEGTKVHDCWHFNDEGPGSLIVWYENGGQVYVGGIFDGNLWAGRKEVVRPRDGKPGKSPGDRS